MPYLHMQNGCIIYVGTKEIIMARVKPEEIVDDLNSEFRRALTAAAHLRVVICLNELLEMRNE